MGIMEVDSVGMTEQRAVSASLLGSLVCALLHHALGWFLLGRFFLRHTLSHLVSPLLLLYG
jgi:hypothetical protein